MSPPPYYWSLYKDNSIFVSACKHFFVEFSS
ncbi:hypothetical protein [Pseudomonas phage vB_Pa-PAC2]